MLRRSADHKLLLSAGVDGAMSILLSSRVAGRVESVGTAGGLRQTAAISVAPARGERTFAVGGEAVAFEPAAFGPDAAALAAPAVPAAPLLADAELTNAAELRGKVAVVRRGGDGVPFHARARRAQQARAVAVVIVNNEGNTPAIYTNPNGRGGDITIPSLCVGRADGERLLLGGAAVVALAYDKPAKVARGRPQALAQAKRVVRTAGGGIAISGLPADVADFNATYAPTGALVDGYPTFSAGPDKHLFRHPEVDQWQLSDEPFDPATDACLAKTPVAGGPVLTGARAWEVADGGEWVVEHEVTAREVA
jgi:hypothetical protein